MSFYICLLLAFGLGLQLRPIFESNPASDSQYEDFDRRFFGIRTTGRRRVLAQARLAQP
jgi:hypothetical protein